jgi:competence protein ComEC
VGGLVVGLTALGHPLNLFFLAILLVAVRPQAIRLTVVAGFLAGLLLSPTPAPVLQTREKVDGEGRVVSVPRLHREVTTFELQTAGRKLLATAPRGAAVALGDRVRVSGVARPLSEGSEAFLRMHGISGRIRLEGQDLRVEAHGAWPLRLADEWRRSFLAFCARSVDEPVAVVADALCFNVDTLLDERTHEGLRRTGTVHIVSASGLHVMVFAWALQALLACLPVPRIVQVGLVAFVLGLYALATGLQPPIIRAVVMAMAVLSAYLFRREGDFPSSLALVALVLLVWKPSSVYDIGFQLSFCTVAAMGLFLFRDRDEWSVVRETNQMVKTSLVATAASAPIVAYHFGTFPVLSVAANLLVALVVPVVIVGALVAHPISFAVPAVAQGIMSMVVAPLVGWIYWVVGTLSAPSWSVLSVPAFSGYWIALLYLAALATWRRRVVHP